MKLFKSPVRRAAAVAAGTLLGLGGVAFAATPASAHHSLIEPTAACVNADGTWQVTWKLRSSERDITGEVTFVGKNPDKSTLTGVAVGTTLPKAVDPALVATQTDISKNAREAKLTISAKWIRNGQVHTDLRRQGTQQKPTTLCAGPSTPVSTPPVTPPVSTSPSAQPSTSPSTRPSVTPSTRPTPPVFPSPSGSAASIEPRAFLDRDCTSMTIGLENPAGGETVTLNFKTSTGETSELVVRPGEIKQKKFDAKEGFSVTVSAEGLDGGSQTIAYESPEDCDNAAGGTGGGALPVTGAAVGSIAGGAAALLAIGAGLFFLARRRKVKFTA